MVQVHRERMFFTNGSTVADMMKLSATDPEIRADATTIAQEARRTEVVRQIVEKHGGTIRADNANGGGARFEILFARGAKRAKVSVEERALASRVQ